MLPQRIKKAITDNPKKLANLIDLVNLPSTLREFVGQSQISRLGCFMRVWSYIKANNLQVTNLCHPLACMVICTCSVFGPYLSITSGETTENRFYVLV